MIESSSPPHYAHLCKRVPQLLIVACLFWSNAVFGQTTIGQESAVITSDTTWGLAGSPYTLTRDVEVRSQAKLTIEPGVEVRFNANDLAATNNVNGVEILVRGSLIAVGTEADPIRFTGQDLPGPAENSTGVIFALGANSSELEHVDMAGLAYGVNQQGDMSLRVESVSINATYSAFTRLTGGSDLILNQVDLTGGERSLDFAGLSEGVFTRINGSTLEGAAVFHAQSQGITGFNSEVTLDNSMLTGDLTFEGNLQAGAELHLTDSSIHSGGVIVVGDVNTGARIEITESTVSATHLMPALEVQGSILSDAVVDVTRSTLNGWVKLGPNPELGGAGEGQYFLMSEPATWSDAAASCAAQGGKLADAAGLNEARSIFSAAQGGATSLVWIGGSIEAQSCEAGADYVELTDFTDCRAKSDLNLPVRTVTEGYECACDLNCPLRSQTREQCSIHNFDCFESATFSARLPTCDAASVTGNHCYGDTFNWSWESGEAVDHAESPWAEGEADRLTCLGASPNLQDELHIVIDTQDSTGSNTGELGLWRARAADQMYSYVCEGRVGVPSTQEVSRGNINIASSSISGGLSVRAGLATIFQSSVGRESTLMLYRGGSVLRSQLSGSLNITSRDEVEVSANSVTLTTSPNGLTAGGGILVESEHAVIYGNQIDGGSYGVVIRGTGEVSNNLVTRINEVGVKVFPANTEAGREVMIANNTLVDAHHGVNVEGLIDDPATRLHNNNVYRGAGVGVERVGAAPIITNANNVFAYDTLYSGLSPDASSVSANPGFVADYPAADPIFRLDSGSPLIDLGRCDLAPIAPVSEGGLKVDIDGIPRPFDGDFDQNPGCDIGAYEFGPEELFIYADGQPADASSFSTGREVELTLWGRRDANIFQVNPAVWTILEEVGRLNEETDQFRPGVTPGFFAGGIQAQFGNLTTSLDIDLTCGCPAPDRADGSPGECNGVPDCYFDDWACPVRENYCEIAEMGSFESPLTVAAEDSEQIRAGARDIFGFVFKYNQPFTYEIVNGGGVVNVNGVFTADANAGDYPNSLRITASGVSGLTDIKIVPNTPAEIIVSRPSQTVLTTRTLLYSAQVKDAFGNLIPEAQVTWSIGAAGGATIDPITGRVTAGCDTGVFPNAVVATFGGVTGQADLAVEPGGALIDRIDVTPLSLEIDATTQTNFSATVTDTCLFTRPADNPVFSVDPRAGTIEENGTFTASCQLGAFTGAVTVNAEGQQTSVNVLINSAPLKSLSIQPNTAQVRMNSFGEFEAVGIDECDRPKIVEPIWSAETITGGSVNGAGLAVNGQRLNIGCSDVATIPGGLRATYTDPVYGRVFNASATIQVQAGEVFELTVPAAQSLVSLPAGNETTLQANASDICGNPRQDAIRWSASNGAVDQLSGVYTAGCTRGVFPNAIFVQAGGESQLMDVEVTDGVLSRIEILPNPVTAQAGSTLNLNAQLFDGCDNLIDEDPVWYQTEGGSVTPEGVLTVSQEARTYFGAIVAERNGIQSIADLVVTPANAAVLEVSPDPFIVAAGSVSEVEVTAFDTYGNDFTPEVNWTVNPNAGRFNDEGDFVAGTVVDTYVSGLIARVGTAELEVDVEVVAGPVSSLNIQPNPVEVSALGTVQLTAQPVDEFDNEVTNLPITWSVEAGGGQINGQGLFTASNIAGEYTDTIVASGGGIVQRVSAIVQPSAAVRLSVIPNPLVLIPQAERQLLLEVFDVNDNQITPANVIYAVESGGAHFSVSPTGLVRALQLAGEGVIQVNANGLTTTVELMVTPGAVSQIEVRRPEQNELVLVQDHITVTPGAVINFAATPLDAFDNPVEASLIWSTNVDGFGVTANGVFTAGVVAGEYPNAIRVRHLNVEKVINVTIVPGAPVELHVEPSVIRASPGTTQQLSAYFTDAHGNIVDVEEELRWRRSPSASIEMSATGGLEVGCSVGPDYYSQVVSVSTQPGSPLGDMTGSADVEVTAGETTSINFTPIRYEVAVDQQVIVNARAEDNCGYSTVDVPTFSVISGEGAISAEGMFTASTVTGSVTIRAAVGEISSEASITVNPGAPTRLRISPREVSVVAGTSQQFEVEAEDEFGNLWAPLSVEWAVADGDGEFDSDEEPEQPNNVGQIDSQGLLDAANKTGTFENSVRVTFSGLNAFADVVIEPNQPASIIVLPESEILIPNQIKSFNASVYDRFDNLITSVVPTFEANPEAGIITESGLFTATDRVGVYPEAVEARVSPTVVGYADVTIANSEPARVEIEPQTIRTHVGASPVFTAVVYDTEGVVIEGAAVEWRLDNDELGTLSPSNDGIRLNVKNNPGSYYGGLVAEVVTSEGLTQSGTADVIIPRDFDEDGVDDVIENETGLDPNDRSDAALDDDDDGLTNGEEVIYGLDHRDADTDDDGIRDGDEELWNSDSDGDTLVNANDNDSDGDGVLDGVEAGITQPTPDTMRSNFTPDTDPSTTTSPLNPDSDGDGIEDGVEDSNQNGRLDPGETPPNRDIQVIACDASLAETGCPAELECIENICSQPLAEEPPAPDDGCNASRNAQTSWMFLFFTLTLGLIARRRSASHSA